MPDIYQEFKNLISKINQENVSYAVCGGWALAIHGVPRATVDIDILVLSENLERVWEIAVDLGYDVEGLPLSFDDGFLEIRRISKLDKVTKVLCTIDFLLVTDGLKNVWEAREQIDFEEDKVWTVSREGLIFMKKASGRHKDLGDIDSLSEQEYES